MLNKVGMYSSMKNLRRKIKERRLVLNQTGGDKVAEV